jgi:YidC/Oxa1 family membrane protein insertase
MTRNFVIFFFASVAIMFGWYGYLEPKFFPQPKLPVAATAPTAPSAATAAAPVSSAQPAATAAAAPAPAPAMKLADEKTVKLQTSAFDIELGSWGARFNRLELRGVTHKGTDGKEGPLDLVGSEDNPRYGSLELPGYDLNQGWTLLTPQPEKSADGQRVRFGLKLAGGLVLEKSFNFRPDGQKFDVSVKASNNGKAPLSLAGLSLLWGPNLGGENVGAGVTMPPYGVVQMDGRLERVKGVRDAGSQSFSAPRWVALRNHYFVLSWFPAEGSAWNKAEVRQLGGVKLITALQADGLSLAPGQTLELKTEAYAGPQEYDALKSVGHNFQAVVQFQFYRLFDWLSPLCVGLLHVLKWFHRVTGNWGVAIILLTLLVRGALFWPSLKSMVSMRKMQTKMAQMQPRLDTLKKVYKDDPTKMNQEMMKLYKEYGVNPLGGCVPMLLQIPIFFALYGTLNAAFELRGAPFLWKWTDLTAGDPTYIFPIAMGISMFFQQKLAPQSATVTEDQQQMQKTMLWMMPIMFTGMALYMKWPMGLLLYWTASNLFGVAQQVAVNKAID